MLALGKAFKKFNLVRFFELQNLFKEWQNPVQTFVCTIELLIRNVP
jgi:hypothetical protein